MNDEPPVIVCTACGYLNSYPGPRALRAHVKHLTAQLRRLQAELDDLKAPDADAPGDQPTGTEGSVVDFSDLERLTR